VRRRLNLEDPISHKMLYALMAHGATSGNNEASKAFYTHFANKIRKIPIRLNNDEWELLKKLVDATLSSATKQLLSLGDTPERTRLELVIRHYKLIAKELHNGNGTEHTTDGEIDDSEEGLQGEGRTDDVPVSGGSASIDSGSDNPA
jgi:hypothetical protein